MNELRRVAGRVDGVHCINLDCRNCPEGVHASVQELLRVWWSDVSACVLMQCFWMLQCVLGHSSQPIEVSGSIIKACHWLVHELG